MEVENLGIGSIPPFRKLLLVIFFTYLQQRSWQYKRKKACQKLIIMEACVAVEKEIDKIVAKFMPKKFIILIVPYVFACF